MAIQCKDGRVGSRTIDEGSGGTPLKIFLRILAVALVVVALLPRGVERHDRVLLVLVDGAALEDIERRISAGSLPTFARLIADGIVRSVNAAGGSADLFWQRVFAGTTSGRDGSPHRVSRFWDSLAINDSLILVNVPQAAPADYPGAVVLAGADELHGFVGDNVGVVERYHRLVRGDLDWPHDAASTRVAEVATQLRPGEISDWIEVKQDAPDGRAGRFNIHRLDDDEAYLSPVYRMTTVLSSALEVYVADDPTWASDSERLAEYYPTHVSGLARVRGIAAAEIAGREGWRLMVYFDPTLALIRNALAAGEVSNRSQVIADAYVELDQRLARLVEAAGPGTAVAVVGFDSEVGSPKSDGAEPNQSGSGFLVLSPGEGREDGRAVSPEQVEASLRYLAGLPDSAARAEPIHAVQARFRRPETPELFEAVDNGRRELPFSVESFEALGLLSASADAPRPEDGDGSVSEKH